MTRLLALAVLLVASGGIACTQQTPEHPITWLERVAECTLTPADMDRIVADLLNKTEGETVDALLAEHACEHGWGLMLGEPDYVDSKQAVKCPQAVLDRMAAFRFRIENWNCPFVCEDFAVALERAGELDRALGLIDSALSVLEPALLEDRLRWSIASYPSSRLARVASVLCEREGRIERALEYANLWVPISSCGNYDEAPFINYSRARLLFELERFDEAIAIARNPELHLGAFGMCLWIDCKIASGRCRDSESALRVVRDGSATDSKTVEECELGKRLWDLRHSTRKDQLDNLSALTDLDEDFSLPLALSLDEQGLRDHLNAFDVVESHLRDEPMADLLAYTGRPELRVLIERAETQLGDSLEYTKARWESANRRLIALSSKR